MTAYLAARRRKRLIAKLNRAWWRTAFQSMKLTARQNFREGWYDLSEDLFEILRSLQAGEPIDAPFPQDPWPPQSPIVAALAALRRPTSD